MMTELKVLKALCDCFTDLGDEQFQQRVWVLGLGPEVSSYEDGYEDLMGFDPKLLIEEASPELLSSQSYEKIRNVIPLLENFDDKPFRNQDGWVDPEKLLKNPLWHKIQRECMDCARTIDEEFFKS
jgi:hypothetical protein